MRYSRRLLTGFLLPVLTSMTLIAGPVDAGRAKAVASVFLNSPQKDIMEPLSLSMDNSKINVNGQEDPAFYVVSRKGGGFALIAGDDRMTPVLAYSDNGSFSTADIPDNLRSWIIETCAEISRAKANGIAAASSTAKSWAILEAGSPTPLKAGNSTLLETALWDQGTPYNNLCPAHSGRKTYSGCVATAMAIVMYYHKWPDAGNGRIEDYSYESGLQSYFVQGYDLGYAYDWDSMLHSYTGGAYSEQEALAVATLMRDCGHMVKMMYSTTGSGAYFYNVLPPILRHMDYDKSAIAAYQEDYTSSDWISLLKQDLDEGLPVFYTATTRDEGHAFVLDGYDENDYFHINWGWSGVSNGYFRFPEFSSFLFNHAAILGLRPNGSRSAGKGICLSQGDGVSGLTTTCTEFRQDVPFDVKFAVTGTSENLVSGELTVVRQGRLGSGRTVVSSAIPVSVSSSTPVMEYELSCTLKTEPQIGERLRLCFREDSGKEWKEINAGDGTDVPWEILIADEFTLEEMTGLQIYSSDKTMHVRTKPGTEYILTDPDGEEVLHGSTSPDSGFDLDFTGIGKGSYRLILTKGTETKCLNITL